jgi:hypothetical protein
MTGATKFADRTIADDHWPSPSSPRGVDIVYWHAFDRPEQQVSRVCGAEAWGRKSLGAQKLGGAKAWGRKSLGAQSIASQRRRSAPQCRRQRIHKSESVSRCRGPAADGNGISQLPSISMANRQQRSHGLQHDPPALPRSAGADRSNAAIVRLIDAGSGLPGCDKPDRHGRELVKRTTGWHALGRISPLNK